MGYYIVKNPEVENKLKKFHEDLVGARKAACELVLTIADAEELYYERNVGTRVGGVHGVVFPAKKAPRGWKKNTNGSYYPHQKNNKESFAAFEALPSVDKQDLNDALEFKIYKDETKRQISLWPGITLLNGIFYIEVPDYVDGQWIMPLDVVEITSAQFRQAKSEMEAKEKAAKEKLESQNAPEENSNPTL